MVCAPVSRRFVRWKLASLLALALGAAGAASAAPAKPVLLFPVKAASGLAPVATAATQALPLALARHGWEATLLRPDSPLAAQAARDGWVPLPDVEAGRLEAHRYALGLAAHAEAVLTAKLTPTGDLVALEVTVAGVVAQRPQILRVTASLKSPPDCAGAALAQDLAAALTPQVWAALGADPEGRRQAAAVRYAAGRTAERAGRIAAARLAYEAACAGAPESPEYLVAAARVLDAEGHAELALARAERALQLRPEEASYRHQVAELLLHAGRAEQARTAFGALLETDAYDAIAQEGLARALRAKGDREGAREHYARLLRDLPALRDEPASLAGLLADLREDTVRLSALPNDQVALALARLYVGAGEDAHAIRVLGRDPRERARPSYADADYVILAVGLDREADRLAQEVEQTVRESRAAQTEVEAAELALTALHDRSTRLADASEGLAVSTRVDAAHRFRVLAYNALNQSNYEALLYVRTNDATHRRRSALLREASRTALQEAVDRQEAALAPLSTPAIDVSD